MNALFLRLAALAVLLLSAPAALAASQLVIRRTDPAATIAYGSQPEILATLTYSGACDASPVAQGALTLFVDGGAVGNNSFALSFSSSCGNGVRSVSKFLSLPALDIGTHDVVLRYEGEPGVDPATSPPLRITIAAEYFGTVPGAPGSLAAGMAPLTHTAPGLFCPADATTVTFTAAPQPPASTPPPNVPFPFGFVNYRASCFVDCGFLCPPLGEIRVQQFLQVVFPNALPRDATFWLFAPSNRDPAPSWRQVPARVEGNRATVLVQGGFLGDVPDRDPLLRGALGVSASVFTAPRDVRGMWWGGLDQNGWGLSLDEQNDRLFGVLYVYGNAGEPEWFVIANGAWNATHTTFSAAVHRPLSPSGQGEVAGSASLTFTAQGAGLVEYNIDGVSGTKRITRMPGPAGSTFAGVWDEMPRGGGLTLDAVGDSLFVGWPTFLAGDTATWLVMPAGAFTSSTTFEGTLYRTSSSSWLGGYDPRSLQVGAAGSMKITFTDANHATLDFTVDGVSGTRTIVRRRF